MSHSCHHFWKCYKTLTFCSLLTRCTIPCACHATAHLNVQKWSEHVVFLTFWLRNVLRATMACTFSTSQLLKVARSWCVLYILTSKCALQQLRALFRFFSTSQLPKVVRTWWVLYILTWKRALRYNGVHFFDISTSKSGPELVVLCILPSKCASRHNGVHFFISDLARWLRTRRFSEPTFRPSEPQISGKTQCFATFLFAHLHRLAFDSFSSLIFSLLLFSSLWPFPSLLFICPYCRKFDF